MYLSGQILSSTNRRQNGKGAVLLKLFIKTDNLLIAGKSGIHDQRMVGKTVLRQDECLDQFFACDGGRAAFGKNKGKDLALPLITAKGAEKA